MRATAERIVEHDDIARFESALCALSSFDGRRNRHGHRAQVHRHVIAHGYDLAVGIEDRAGVVATLFDIGGKGGAAQCGSHFFGNGVVEVLEDLEFDRITHARDECTSSWDDCGP